MWGNGQPKDYFDPDSWNFPAKKKKFPLKWVIIVSAALLIAYVLWS